MYNQLQTYVLAQYVHPAGSCVQPLTDICVGKVHPTGIYVQPLTDICVSTVQLLGS